MKNIAKENQKVFYYKTIFNLKNNNQIEMKKLDEHKNNEIKEMESKYNKLKSQLDSIKDEKEFIEFLNNINF
jgi:predicted  nucleic acid-binding Zn-ribbon protein